MRIAAVVAGCVAALAIAICPGQTRPAGAVEDLAALAQNARNALLADRFDEAIGLYQRLVQALPAEPGARLNLAMALHSAGRYKESVAQLERLRVSQAANARFWFLLGVGYLKLEQPGKAVEPLERAVRLDASYLPNRIELAGALLESGSLEKAEAAFRALTNDEPGLPKAWQGLAVTRLELSREASDALDRLAPDSSFRYALAALAAAGQGDREQARALYRKALAAAPAAPWLEAELAALSDGVKPGQDARPAAGHPLALAFFSGEPERVLALSPRPRDPEALYWRSRAYAELARGAVERLASLPPSAERHELLAAALQRAGRRAEAVAEWREASRMSPADRRIRGELARSLRLNRQYDEAAPLLEELTRLDPARAEWQFELGDCLVNQGRPEQALGRLSRACELQPGLLAAQALLGQVLLQSGDAQAAVAHLEKAAPLDRDGSIHFQLASAYRSLGKPELARQALARQRELKAATGTRGGGGMAEAR
ncbi:MAG: tetratricopeptide repeat protein [Bryobacteraceae bacterium]|nr:tetratricopeptide repeat protein [Bryobacteraceae bacterium]